MHRKKVNRDVFRNLHLVVVAAPDKGTLGMVMVVVERRPTYLGLDTIGHKGCRQPPCTPSHTRLVARSTPSSDAVG